jgi:hypothetical protein
MISIGDLVIANDEFYSEVTMRRSDGSSNIKIIAE